MAAASNRPIGKWTKPPAEPNTSHTLDKHCKNTANFVLRAQNNDVGNIHNFISGEAGRCYCAEGKTWATRHADL